MDVQVKKLHRVDVITVEGRVDSSTAARLGEALESSFASGTRNIVIDLAGVDYMSSAGLRELVAALKRAKSSGGDVRLSAPSERVAEVLEIAGLDSIFGVYGDQVEAVGSF